MTIKPDTAYIGTSDECDNCGKLFLLEEVNMRREESGVWVISICTPCLWDTSVWSCCGEAVTHKPECGNSKEIAMHIPSPNPVHNYENWDLDNMGFSVLGFPYFTNKEGN